MGVFGNKYGGYKGALAAGLITSMIAHWVVRVATLPYVMLLPNLTAVYAAVFVSVLFGPCWATIYAGTLATVENKYTEVAGAFIVMAIVGAAFVPAIQGLVSDRLGSMQLAFGVSLLCFVWVGFYFWGELRHKKQPATGGRLVEEAQ